MDKERARLEFQLLLLDNGAQIKDTISDREVWEDIEARLVTDADSGPRG